MADSQSIQADKEENADVQDNAKNIKEENEDEKVEKSLKYSVYDGAAASFMEGTGNNYIAPFAIAMNATNTEIGLLTSVPNFVAPLFQLKASKLMEHYNRKKIVLIAVLFHALLWLPILSIPFIFKENGAILLIIFFTAFAIAGSFSGPPWASWMGDLVPEDNRGKYFGRRNKIAGIVALASTLIASRFLDFFKTYNKIFYGFAILFFTAMIARLISRYFLSKKYEPQF